MWIIDRIIFNGIIKDDEFLVSIVNGSGDNGMETDQYKGKNLRKNQTCKVELRRE